VDLIVYDGVCVLCSRSIRFVAERDRAKLFRFVPLQSPYGGLLAAKFGIAADNPDTVVAIIDGAASYRSDAALGILSRLPGLAWTRWLRIVPGRLRDGIYDLVARNRYRWFGRYDQCRLPSADLVARVIEKIPPGEDASLPAAIERPLLARILGDAFDVMPLAIRRAHEVGDGHLLAGRATVEGAASRPGRMIARLFGFPPTAADVAVTVEMRADHYGEVWTRTIGGKTFRSRLGPLGRQGLVAERFGPISFALSFSAGREGLDIRMVGARLGPIRLPGWLTPRSWASERVDAEGRFTFDILIALPGLGRLTHYRGWLEAALLKLRC
jgi:predicted DCC family thiol-disulfide oxidoreductase YuxK